MKAIAVVALTLAAGSAAADTAEIICMPRAQFLSITHEQLDRQRVSGGLIVQNGEVVAMTEVFVAEDGQFTIAATDATGRTCVFMVGHGWTDLEPLPAGISG